MERLEFGEGSRYSALEASIHLSRYLTAKRHCQGKRVLDIASGEGYGSALMSRWGATSVVGVDVSAEAVQKARQNFAVDNVRFVQSSGEELPKALEGQQFDLIVSLETIEHVDDPRQVLLNLKSMLAPGGIMVISCPNDAWYYSDGSSNSYHKHRWTAEEFKRFSEGVLGSASWAYGTFGVGFAVYAADGPLRTLTGDDPQESMLGSAAAIDSLLAPMAEDSAPSPADVAYFVGVWGEQAPGAAFAGYPVSMDLMRAMQFTREGANSHYEWIEQMRSGLSAKDEYIGELTTAATQAQHSVELMEAALVSAKEALEEKHARLQATEDELVAVTREKRQDMMLYRIAHEETELLRGQLGHHQYMLSQASEEAERIRAELGHHQYLLTNSTAELANARDQLAQVPWRVVRVWRRVRRFIPTSLLTGVVGMARMVRKGSGQ